MGRPELDDAVVADEDCVGAVPLRWRHSDSRVREALGQEGIALRARAGTEPAALKEAVDRSRERSRFGVHAGTGSR